LTNDGLFAIADGEKLQIYLVPNRDGDEENHGSIRCCCCCAEAVLCC
jgi:hypothetical protein